MAHFDAHLLIPEVPKIAVYVFVAPADVGAGE